MRKKIVVVLAIAFLLNWSHMQTAQKVDGANGALFASLFQTTIVVTIVCAVLWVVGKVFVFVFMSARAAGRFIGGAPKPPLDDDSQGSRKSSFEKVPTSEF